MNFQFAQQGASFKGAMAYYTHDKRAEGAGAHLTTSERVAWSETRNMLTERMATATQIMIATAERAPVLKEHAKRNAAVGWVWRRNQPAALVESVSGGRLDSK